MPQRKSTLLHHDLGKYAAAIPRAPRERGSRASRHSQVSLGTRRVRRRNDRRMTAVRLFSDVGVERQLAQ
jgi:hypothetical protein